MSASQAVPKETNRQSTILSQGSCSLQFDSDASFSNSVRRRNTSRPQQSLRARDISTSLQRDKGYFTTNSQSGGTIANSSLAYTRNAQFHEFDAMLERQPDNIGKLSKLTDQRLGQLERQFHRIKSIEATVTASTQTTTAHCSDMDDRFDKVKQQLVSSMERQLESGMHIANIEKKINSLIVSVQNLAMLTPGTLITYPSQLYGSPANGPSSPLLNIQCTPDAGTNLTPSQLKLPQQCHLALKHGPIISPEKKTSLNVSRTKHVRTQ